MTSRRVAVSAWQPQGGSLAGEWELAEEVPVALAYNGISHAVMMATPADLEDLAIGFTLSEEIVDGADAIHAVEIEEEDKGLVLHLSVEKSRMKQQAPKERSLAGFTGCGLCGIGRLDDAIREPRPVPVRYRPRPEAIAAAFAALPDHQPLNQRNFSMHAAAWCDADGRIVLAREDVGRHNALDKLIGALIAQKIPFDNGFTVMSSRCSLEIVQKAATLGIAAMASLSAPTALAFSIAEKAGMQLAARAPNGAIAFFS